MFYYRNSLGRHFLSVAGPWRFCCRSVAFLLQVCGVSVSGPSVFRPRSAFPSGTCDAFWALVRSAVPGPRTFRGPATPRPGTCDAFRPLVRSAVPGPRTFRGPATPRPVTCDTSACDLRHFLASGAFCRRRSWVFPLPVGGRSVAGPWLFRPRSAFSLGTCDAFRPLARSAVAGPWLFHPRSAFSPVTCDAFRPLVRSAVAGPPTFRGPAPPRPRTCDAFWASGALCRRRSPHISRTCTTSPHDLRHFAPGPATKRQNDKTTFCHSRENG